MTSLTRTPSIHSGEATYVMHDTRHLYDGRTTHAPRPIEARRPRPRGAQAWCCCSTAASATSGRRRTATRASWAARARARPTRRGPASLFLHVELSWPNGQGVALLRRRLWVRVPPGATKLTLRTQALAAALRLARPRLPPRRPLRPAAVAAARPARRLRPPGPLRRPAAVAAARRLPAGPVAAAAGPVAAARRVPGPAARVRRPPLNEFWNYVRLS